MSASHNLGFKELLEAITAEMDVEEESEDSRLKFCFIGRPNVGKSSLINAVLNEDRVIVSDVAGTTRDATDTIFTYNHEEYVMIDTAGMRKKGRIFEEVEKYSLVRSLKAIEKSDVCVLVIDASDPNSEIKLWKKNLESHFMFAKYALVVFVSAKTKKRVSTLMPAVIEAYQNNKKEIKTSDLNRVIEEAVLMHDAPSYKGKKLKIYFTSQTDVKPPKFTFRVNDKGLVHFSYERYLENKIRDNFDLTGTPIILKFKNKKEED